MKTKEMLLWILVTSLLAAFFMSYYWGEHQRRESRESLKSVQRLAHETLLESVPVLELVNVRVPSPGPWGSAGMALGPIPVVAEFQTACPK